MDSLHTHSKLNPLKNDFYEEFYRKLFNGIGKDYESSGFDCECPKIFGKTICMPDEFLRILSTRAMESSKGKIQTGHSCKVYNEMTSTRYDHMCFSYILAVDLLMILEKNGYDIDPKTKTAFILKLLLHDNGHGPFSHAFEEMLDGCYGIHEHIGDKNILKDEELYNILEGIYPGLSNNIVKFKEFDKYGLNELVEGIFDLDRASFLLIDSHLSGIPYEDGDTSDFVDSIYNIFENIVLGGEGRHIYFKKECFRDMERFIGRRLYNYKHIYQAVFRLLDDKLLYQYGNRLSKLNIENSIINNSFLHPLISKVIEFSEFLKRIKREKAEVDLEDFFKFRDIDLETTVLLSKLIGDEELTFLARAFTSPCLVMMYPFDIKPFCTEEEFDRESNENSDELKVKITINPYKSNSEEHVVFIDEDGKTTDFKDMEELSIDIAPVKLYYMFKRKTVPCLMNNEHKLNSIIEDYIFNNIDRLLRDCFSQRNSGNQLKREISRSLIFALIGLLKSISVKEYCSTAGISVNTLMALLSLNKINSTLSYFSDIYSLSSKEKAVIFDELEFRSETEKLYFIVQIQNIILSSGYKCEDISGLFDRLLITNDNHNIIFFNREMLYFMCLEEKINRHIEDLVASKKSIQKIAE